MSPYKGDPDSRVDDYTEEERRYHKLLVDSENLPWLADAIIVGRRHINIVENAVSMWQARAEMRRRWLMVEMWIIILFIMLFFAFASTGSGAGNGPMPTYKEYRLLNAGFQGHLPCGDAYMEVRHGSRQNEYVVVWFLNRKVLAVVFVFDGYSQAFVDYDFDRRWNYVAIRRTGEGNVAEHFAKVKGCGNGMFGSNLRGR